MPIYEFVCDDCGHEFESLQRLSDPLPDTCPDCGKQRVHKKVSAAAFRLKGGGWYETDFKSGQKKNVSAADGAKTDGDSADAATKKSDSSSGESGGKKAESGAKSSAAEPKSNSTAAKKD
ncbi:MAG: FmdB family zinc ribbon protein [Pseudomonadales bacterium]